MKTINNYTCCQKAECKWHQKCVRYENYQKSLKEDSVIEIINPSVLTDEDCDYLLVKKYEKWACGFKKMIDSVPKGRAYGLNFGMGFKNETAYYRARRGENPINPEQQKKVLERISYLGGDTSLDFDNYVMLVVYVKED